MSMSDNIPGHSSKWKNVNRTECSSFPLLSAPKNRLSISEMVSAQYLQKVWAHLKKKLPKLDFFFEKFSIFFNFAKGQFAEAVAYNT